MKNLSTLALLTLLLAVTSLSASARIRRVNNSGVAAVANILYTDINSAHTAAVAGDTLQIEPSGASYGSFNCTKRLVILGPGYFLGTSQNAGLQANPATASFSDMYFSAGAANSVVAGLTIGTFYVQESNVTIQRCQITGYLYLNVSNLPISNINIRQNYIAQMANYYSAATNNLLITNNIITNFVTFPASFNGEFANNVVLSYVSMDNFNVRNNYFGSSFTPASNIHSYNVTAQAAASQPAFTASNNSQTGVSTSAAFALTPAAPGQFDAWYILKSGTNPLRNAGQNGTDIGAFGGNTPYKLSGLPAIPAIYQYTQSVNGNTLNVNMSTRSNN
ncbi:hypothetical protein GCM10023185_00010 [Hymenobacter saemangeumensis]|uniref:Right-handed parallel beta-helix repeat-containing protein n=1 Tax=Hymenobacter saemangeumensis TaxID=1084522 RepID=A0ABP8HW47_9BACT